MRPSTSNSSDIELELIKFVQSNPCLYFHQDEDSKGKTDRIHRKNLWQMFASKHGIDVKKLKDKWNILRTSFNSAYKRYESDQDGTGVKWKYLDAMMFLKNQQNSNKVLERSQTNLDDSDQEIINSINGLENGVSFQEETDNESIVTNNQTQSNDSTNQTNHLNSKRSLETEEFNLNQNSVKRPKKNQINQLKSNNQMNQSEDQTDSIMMFLKSLVPTLKRYKDSQLNIVKYKILAILIEADQEFLNN